MRHTLLLAMMLAMAPASVFAEITLDGILSGRYDTKSAASMTALSDGEHFLTKEGDCLLKGSYKSEQLDTVFNLKTVRGQYKPQDFEGYILSPKEDCMLIWSGRQKIFRRSFLADYYIVSLKNKTIERLTAGGPVQSPKFSPDGNVVGFVRDGNLFIVKLLFNNAELQVTKNGQPGKILNGVPDWCYDEEFGITQAYEFSADSKLLAYVSFDESNVDKFTMPFYQEEIEDGATEQPLLKGKEVWYPVAGSEYSKVKVHSFEIKTSTDRELDLKLDSDVYIPRIAFVEDDDNSLLLFTINRSQNKLEIFSANPRSTICKMILRQTDPRWIEPEEYLDIKLYGTQFIQCSERSGHNHLYLYKSNGQLVRQMTKGDWDVQAFHGWDQKTGALYFECNRSNPYRTEVVRMDGKGNIKTLSQKQGTNHAVFSKNFKYMVNTWSDINTPPYVSVIDAEGKTLRTIADNNDVAAKMAEDGFVKREMFSFKTPEGVELYGWMVKPANADATHKYPLLMYQYGGPGSNEVFDGWGCGFFDGGTFENLFAQKGYIVACVDGRGTGRRGADFKKQTYLRLGVMEADDQVSAARYLSTLPYVDADRIAIWGWSFGGYNTLMAMSQGTPIFKCGIAVAPVTDFRFYDATYTERFMLTPGENIDGYRAASALNRIDKLHGRLLLVHGLVDDNVFFSNTSAYTNALINAGVVYDQLVYPGKEHSLVGTATRKHLFTNIFDFLDSYLRE